MRSFIFLLFLPSICLSQQTINAKQFFETGLSKYQELEIPTREKVNFPWIDRYEFRTETSDFDFDEQEYTIRLSPSTAKIRKAQKAYYEEMRDAPDFEGQEIYCDLKLSLHIDWLSLFILNENKSVMDELLVVFNDKQSIYEKMMGTYEFDPQKLLKLQTERSDLEIALNKIKLEQDYLVNKYNIQNQEIDFGDFISVETVSEYLANLATGQAGNILSSNEAGLVDLETAFKKQLLLKEIELESSEKNKFIDFVQLKYNGPHSDFWQEKLSLGLGFQLSNSGNAKLKMQELQIEKAELDRKSERNIQEKKEKLYTFKNKLQSDIQAFFHFQKTIKTERTELQKLSSKVSQKEGTSPLFLLEVEERNLFMKIKALNKKEDLLRDYLKYMQLSDEICQSDFVNYLTQEQ